MYSAALPQLRGSAFYSEDRATFGQALKACLLRFFIMTPVMCDSRAQALLLGEPIFPVQFCIIAQRHQQLIHAGNRTGGNGGIHSLTHLIQMRLLFSLIQLRF